MKLVLLPETPLADEKLCEYVGEQLGKLVRQLPRAARSNATVEAKFLEDAVADSYHRFVCRLTLSLPEGTFEANEASLNIYAAVDIAIAQLKQACTGRGLVRPLRRQRLAGVLRRQTARQEQGEL